MQRKKSTLDRIKQSARELDRSLNQPPATGLHVFNAESIQKLDTLARELMTTSGSGCITIKVTGGPGKGEWRFDEITLRLDSELSRRA